MNIIWLIMLIVIALAAASLSFATPAHRNLHGPEVKVQGLIVVTDTTPTVVYQK